MKIHTHFILATLTDQDSHIGNPGQYINGQLIHYIYIYK